MDGVMFMHSPRLAKVREILDDDHSIGVLRRITSTFSFYSGEQFFRDNIRVNGALEPAGCLGDLGWYSIRFALWTLNWRLPQTVTARILRSSEIRLDRPSSPVDFSAEMFFEGGVSCAFYCSFIAGHQQWVHVSGQQGWLLLPDFVHPLNSYEPGFEVCHKPVQVSGDVKCPPGVDPKVQGHAAAQDAIMWRNFAAQVLSGKLNADWPLWAAKTQKVMDACLEAAREGRAMKL
jgi:predicted dehydrogenase